MNNHIITALSVYNFPYNKLVEILPFYAKNWKWLEAGSNLAISRVGDKETITKSDYSKSFDIFQYSRLNVLIENTDDSIILKTKKYVFVIFLNPFLTVRCFPDIGYVNFLNFDEDVIKLIFNYSEGSTEDFIEMKSPIYDTIVSLEKVKTNNIKSRVETEVWEELNKQYAGQQTRI